MGKSSNIDLANISNHMGSYGHGTINDNGHALLNFLSSNSLFVCNTAFKHKMRHVTTRTGWIKKSRRHNDESVPFYSQIDYVICRTRFKCTLRDARSYGGANTYSDHKIVCARFNFGDRHLSFRKTSKCVKYDCSALSSNPDVK